MPAEIEQAVVAARYTAQARRATVDTDGVQEMQRPVNLVNVLRDDVPGGVFPVSTVTALAPESMPDGHIRVTCEYCSKVYAVAPETLAA